MTVKCPRTTFCLYARMTRVGLRASRMPGWMQISFPAKPQAHLYYLVTDPSCEGKGVGRMLMDAVEDFARDKSATGILLYVFSTNERARSVYERYGFQDDMLKMVKPVSATRASGHSSK